MPQPRKDTQAEQMYELYLQGYSLAEVGTHFGVKRQSVYGMLSSRGYALRTRTLLPTVEYDGHLYTVDRDGYYRRTTGGNCRKLLHQAVWEKHHGPIPAGMEIHHRDKNKTNNAIENLACLTPEDHAAIHRVYKPVPEKRCDHCGELLVRKWQRNGTCLETPAAVTRRRFCNPKCHGRAMRGRPKGMY